MSAFRALCLMSVFPICAVMAGLETTAPPESVEAGVSSETPVLAGPAKTYEPPPIITDIDRTHRYDSAIPGITRTGDGATEDHALPTDTSIEDPSDAAIDPATLDKPMSPELRDKFRETWNLTGERARLREQKRKEYGVSKEALSNSDGAWSSEWPDGRLSRPSYQPERRYLKRFRSHFRVGRRARRHRSDWPHRRSLWKHLERGINAESPLVPHLPRVRPFGYHEYNGPWPWEREDGADVTAPDKDRLSL